MQEDGFEDSAHIDAETKAATNRSVVEYFVKLLRATGKESMTFAEARAFFQCEGWEGKRKILWFPGCNRDAARRAGGRRQRRAGRDVRDESFTVDRLERRRPVSQDGGRQGAGRRVQRSSWGLRGARRRPGVLAPMPELAISCPPLGYFFERRRKFVFNSSKMRLKSICLILFP